jgi:hypothetical protein
MTGKHRKAVTPLVLVALAATGCRPSQPSAQPGGASASGGSTTSSAAHASAPLPPVRPAQSAAATTTARCAGEFPCAPPGASKEPTTRAACLYAAAHPPAWQHQQVTLRTTTGRPATLIAAYTSTAGGLDGWDFGDPSVEQLASYWPNEPVDRPATLCYLGGPFKASDGRGYSTAILEQVGSQTQLVLAGTAGQAILHAAPPPG